MEYLQFICVMFVLANSPTGSTAGRVGRSVANFGCKMSRDSAERILKKMVKAKYAIVQSVKYRGNIDKKLYFLSTIVVDEMAQIVEEYEKAEKQLTLDGKVRGQ